MASQTIFVTSPDSLKRLKIPLAAITARVHPRGAPVPLVMNMRPIPVQIQDLSTSDEDQNTDPEPMQPRKRQRLTHLSTDERMQRRKMKNRVAAQTARDRKKAKMDDLGERVTDLENQNKFLLARNRQLEKAIDILFEDNKSLKTRVKNKNSHVNNEDEVEEVPTPVDEKTKIVEVAEPIVKVKNEIVDTAVESAALVVPQQKGQAQSLTATLMTCMMMMALSAYCSFWKNLAVVVVSRRYIAQQIVMRNLSPPHQLPNHHQTLQKLEEDRQMKWWGPRQNSWSPSKN